MRTSDFDYTLPPERIAQTPLEPRHASRLMVLHRSGGTIEHSTFWNIGAFLQPADLLVINQTRVIPARIFARKPTGGRVELLLLKRLDENTWEVLAGGKHVGGGLDLQLEDGPTARVVEALEGARRVVRFSAPVEAYLEAHGQAPLPPYIHTPLADRSRYQTVYAVSDGSAAAPTAGLHFTPELMQNLQNKGIGFATLTLHVGLDTFAPVSEDDPEEHKIHSEWCELTPECAEAINAASRRGGRIVAVGTTSVRTLETAAAGASAGERVAAYCGPTRLFILPGYNFRAVDALVTNFHLPRSSLIMLVSAFAGRERILEAYRQAVDMGYRFYSFGDAMLTL